MSFLKLHSSKTKTINILGKDFKFNRPSSTEYISLMQAAQGDDIKLVPQLTAQIVAANIVGEKLTKKQILDTFSFDEMLEIALALVGAFNQVDEMGKR